MVGKNFEKNQINQNTQMNRDFNQINRFFLFFQKNNDFFQPR